METDFRLIGTMRGIKVSDLSFEDISLPFQVQLKPKTIVCRMVKSEG